MRGLLIAFSCAMISSVAFAQDRSRIAEPPGVRALVYCATVRYECPTSNEQTPDVIISGVPGNCNALDVNAENVLKDLYPDFNCVGGEEPVLVYVVDCHSCKPGEWPPNPDPEPFAYKSGEPRKVCGMTCYYTFANGKKRGFSAYGRCARQIIASKACRYAIENCTQIASCDSCKCAEVNPDSNCITGCRQCR